MWKMQPSLFLFLVILSSMNAQEVSFSYTDFSKAKDIYRTGDANLTSEGAFLTGDVASSTGRIMHSLPVPLCDAYEASFSTTFTFIILRKNASMANTDGFAFTIAPKLVQIEPNSSMHGRMIGLLEPSSNGMASNQLVAVEFDTWKNYPGSTTDGGNNAIQDIDDNHVGLDINSIMSINSTSLYPLNLRLGGPNPVTMAAKIEYDASLHLLKVYVSNDRLDTFHGKSPVLEHTFKLCAYVNSKSYVGFSSGSGGYVTYHKILSWEFETFKSPISSSGNSPDLVFKVLFIISATCVLVLSMLFTGTLYYVCSRRLRNQNQSLVLLPHEISYPDVVLATQDFAQGNLLGSGGFGSVYKGVLPEDGSMVAIKRVSRDSNQGEREFLAEVKIISKLSHRNLVKLRGWCQQKKDLILVYEYMPEGSVAQALFSEGSSFKSLSWTARHRVVCGLAAGILYLHEEWEQQVVHRDIKCSNVMLDSEFNARLGDFGLARVVKHNSMLETTLPAGTLGYIAPEVGVTYKLTPASNTYSFGVVVFEIMCGRRVLSSRGPLLPWVEECHQADCLLEVVDSRLHAAFPVKEMIQVLAVAFECVNHDPSKRPSMRQVVHTLYKTAGKYHGNGFLVAQTPSEQSSVNRTQTGTQSSSLLSSSTWDEESLAILA